MTDMSHPEACLAEDNSRGVVLAWVALATFLLLLLWAAVAFEIRRESDARSEAALKIVHQLVDVHSRRLQAEIADIEQILGLLASVHEAGANGALLDRQMRAVSAQRPLFPFFADPEGIVTSARTPAGLGVDLSDNPVFLDARSENSSQVHVYRAPGFGALQGQIVIRFARRVERDGKFSGVMALTATEPYFRSISAPLRETLGQSVAVWFSDGRMMAVLHGKESWLPSPLRGRLSIMPTVGVIEYNDDVTGEAYVGWRRLPRNGLVVTAVVPRRELMGGRQDGSDSRLALGMICTMLIVFASWQGARAQMQHEQRRREQQVISSTFRLAVDSAREGFYMIAVVPIEGSREVRFRIEDCNEFAASLAAIPRSQIFGRHFPDVFPGTAPAEVDRLLHTALREGFCEADLYPRQDGKSGSTWLNFSAVRSHGGLAVTVRDITELKEKESQLRSMALTDALTLLPNRHWLKQHLPESIAAARAGGTRIALLFIDLDDFKKINDALGHQAGDQYLAAVAVALRSAVRRQDTVIRLGGDEFTVLVESVENRASVEVIGQQIIACFEEIEPKFSQSGFTPRASVGAALFPDDAADDAALMQAADIAMYAAKSEGKGRLCMYSAELARTVQSKLQMEQGLRTALSGRSLSLRYQPRVCTRSGKLIALEALLRWEREDGNMTGPEDFIALAEQSDLILELGKWVVSEACRQLAQWRDDDLHPPPVSINVSARQLRSDSFRKHVGAQLKLWGLPPSQLAIELTESVMVGDEPIVRGELSALRRMGIELHIDDFGTGYSSLSQLLNLEVDTIKIDRSFVKAIGNGAQGAVLCKAMVQMARTLGFRVVAEGVENVEQLHELQRMYCDEVQGFLIARPVLPAEIPALIARDVFFETSPSELVRVA